MTGRRMGAAIPLDEITEKTWDRQLFSRKDGLAPMLGWTLTYHTLRSKGSTSGFPDRVLVRERVIFVELKRELTGKPSVDRDRQPTAAQREWLTALARAGAELYVWRPSDLDEIAQILAWRGWFGWGVHGTGLNHDGDDASWLPKSLWLPAGHRNDENVQEVIAAA